MRAPWLVFLPVLLFGQSTTAPRERAPVDNAVTGTKSAKDSTPKEGQGARQPPSVSGGKAAGKSSQGTQQATQSSPLGKTTEVAPDPIVRYTLWLVIVGALQFVALIVQSVFLYLAFRETTKATELTAAAVAEAQRSNAANEELTLESNLITRTGTGLTRQSLVLSHPPRIVIRNIEMNDMIFKFRTIPGGPQGSIPATGTARLFNKGGSTAHVTAWCCHVFLFERLPMKLPFGPPEIQPDAPVDLPPGKFGTMPFPTTPRDPITIPEIFELGKGALAIYVMGAVVYGDDFGNLRTTSFCREWRYEDQQFSTVNNRDYEDGD